MTMQSIIVYRNPIEAAFWESNMLIPLLGGMAAGVGLFLLMMWVAGKIYQRRYGPPDWVIWFSAAVSIILSGWTVHCLII